MALRANFTKRVFQFNFKARTSRGVMKDKTSWFIRIWNENEPTIFGLGEAGPLPGLSVEAGPDFENELQIVIDSFNQANHVTPSLQNIIPSIPERLSSVRFAFEMALLDLQNKGKRVIYENHFLHGHRIPINGLIWMGDMDFMMGQISVKLWEGFRCIKLKVGGLNFDQECDILNYIRKRYYRENLVIRLDANGAFKLEDALYKLEELSRFNIHSIEQPIKPGQPEMEEICRKSPIPIAFDEELIGIHSKEEQEKLLDVNKPAFIVLKPTLHGGLQSTEEWIRMAEARNIGWWVTSSLESSIGLNAICQFTAQYNTSIPQGLGTGKIYENNFESPLEVDKGDIYFNSKVRWDQVTSDVNADFSSVPPDFSARQISE